MTGRAARATSDAHREAAFTLVEVLVASLLALTALAVLAPLMQAAHAWSRVVPAEADLSQRARVVATRIERVLLAAGSGPARGPSAGSLGALVPGVFPHLRRVPGSDPPLSAGTDRLTVWRVDGSLALARLAADMTTASDPLALAWDAPCDALNPACHFEPGDAIAIADRSGRFAVFEATATPGNILLHSPVDLGAAFRVDDDTTVAALRVTTLAFDAAARSIRIGDGRSERPLVDHVASMHVRYYGDPRPPATPRPPIGQVTCLFDVYGSPSLAELVADHGAWVELRAADLSDGPTCGAGRFSYDADLLRVRRVVVTVRLEAAHESLRGADPARFANPGSARTSAVVGDREVVIDVAPRNLHWP